MNSRHWKIFLKPPLRTLFLLLAVLGLLYLGYQVWTPGVRVTDGRHDLGQNGLWLQHGWLGHDSWFQRYGKDKSLFRDTPKIVALRTSLAHHGISVVFPHLCPCDPSGDIALVDGAQTERFLDNTAGIKVLPWIGGVLDTQVHLDKPEWRKRFAASTAKLLQEHPRLAGVHVNIEPLPSGNAHFLSLLEELRAAMPEGKMLSVAAYPPPTWWHPFEEVHWEESYFRSVAARCDQMAVMMYDTAIQYPKFYEKLVGDWTEDVLAWSGDTEVLLGLPAYDDDGVGYHFPNVENLYHALRGVHGALGDYDKLPKNYHGVAIYSEWEMDGGEWDELEQSFLRSNNAPSSSP